MKLIIDNSECRIEGLSIAQHKALKDILSYTTDPKVKYFTGGYVKKLSLLSSKGVFPTGLLYIAKKYLYASLQPYEEQDVRKAPNTVRDLSILPLGYAPYAEQIAAAKACHTFKRGIVVAPTGVGKSLICSLIIDKLKVRTLVVVPSLELKSQLTTTLQRAFGESKVGEGKDIWVQNVDALDSNKIVKSYDCVIIDEFHHSGAKSYRKLNKKAWSSIYYKFGLTATPFRSQDHERLLLESVLSQVIYRVDYQNAIKSKYIVPMEAYYLNIPKTKIKGNQRSWPAMYSELVVNNDIRNSIIQELLLKLHTNNLSTLCLVKEINHGEILSANGAFPLVTGVNDERHLIEKFNKCDITTLVSTTGIMGEGVDSKPCEYVIIAGLGKSKNAFMQQVGRGFRNYPGKESCKIILLRDTSHKWTKDHFKAQCKYLLEEYGVVPQEIRLNE